MFNILTCIFDRQIKLSIYVDSWQMPFFSPERVLSFFFFFSFVLRCWRTVWDFSSTNTAPRKPCFVNFIICFAFAWILKVCLVNVPWNQNDLLSGFLCFWSCCRMVCFPNDVESLVKFRKQDIRISQLTQFMDIIKRSLLPSAVKARQGETQCCKVIMTK